MIEETIEETWKNIPHLRAGPRHDYIVWGLKHAQEVAHFGVDALLSADLASRAHLGNVVKNMALGLLFHKDLPNETKEKIKQQTDNLPSFFVGGLLSRHPVSDLREIMDEKVFLARSSIYASIPCHKFELAGHHFTIENFALMLPLPQQEAYFNGLSHDNKLTVINHKPDSQLLAPAILTWRENQKVKHNIEEEIADTKMQDKSSSVKDKKM